MKIIVMGVIGDVIKPGRRKTRVPTAIRLWAADMATSCVWTARHFEVKKKSMSTICGILSCIGTRGPDANERSIVSCVWGRMHTCINVHVHTGEARGML